MICGGGRRILDAGQLDGDLVVALRADLGLRHAEAVDAAAHDLHRAVEVLGGELAVLGRHRLQGHLETTLQVEPERRFLVQRRAGNGEQADADERGEDEREDDDCGSTCHVASLRAEAAGAGLGRETSH